MNFSEFSFRIKHLSTDREDSSISKSVLAVRPKFVKIKPVIPKVINIGADQDRFGRDILYLDDATTQIDNA